jgi:hypothetical protein
MIGTLSISLSIAVIVLLGVLVWRERRAAMLSRAADQLDSIVRSGRLAERVRTEGPDGCSGRDTRGAEKRFNETVSKAL